MYHFHLIIHIKKEPNSNEYKFYTLSHSHYVGLTNTQLVSRVHQLNDIFALSQVDLYSDARVSLHIRIELESLLK